MSPAKKVTPMLSQEEMEAKTKPLNPPQDKRKQPSINFKITVEQELDMIRLAHVAGEESPSTYMRKVLSHIINGDIRLKSDIVIATIPEE